MQKYIFYCKCFWERFPKDNKYSDFIHLQSLKKLQLYMNSNLFVTHIYGKLHWQCISMVPKRETKSFWFATCILSEKIKSKHWFCFLFLNSVHISVQVPCIFRGLEGQDHSYTFHISFRWRALYQNAGKYSNLKSKVS